MPSRTQHPGWVLVVESRLLVVGEASCRQGLAPGQPTGVPQEGVSQQLVAFAGGELPCQPCCHAGCSLSFPPVNFAPNPESLTSQRRGEDGVTTVGEDLRGLNSHLLPSLPPPLKAVTRERSFSSRSGYRLRARRDVRGRLSSPSTDGIRQLLPFCSHRLHSLHLFPFSARNNFGGEEGGALKNVSLMLLEMLFCV